MCVYGILFIVVNSQPSCVEYERVLAYMAQINTPTNIAIAIPSATAAIIVFCSLYSQSHPLLLDPPTGIVLQFYIMGAW